MEHENLNTEKTDNSDLGDVRRSADVWWRKLNHEKKVKYATEHLIKYLRDTADRLEKKQDYETPENNIY